MIMITGGTGFIGSHLVESLCARGETVRCLIRRKNRSFQLPPQVEVVEGDLISGEGIDEALRGAEVAIHLAGVTKALSNDEDTTRGMRAQRSGWLKGLRRRAGSVWCT